MLYAGGMTCEQCGGKVAVPERQGRRARFCSNACRQRAYRARRSGVPVCMRERVRWVRWVERRRGAKMTKVPLSLSGHDLDVRDSRRWVSFDEARRSKVGTGFGIVLGDGLGCIDLDEALDATGQIRPWAQEVVNGYADDSILTEVSVSGRGLHVFLPMSEGPGKRIRDGERNIEIYSSPNRYIAVTGRSWGATPRD